MSNKETIGELARQLLELDEGELHAREKAVIDKVVRRLAVSRNINVEIQRSKTFGQHLADRVAEIGGSWSFIIGFGVVIAVWVSVNTWLARRRRLRSLSLHLPQPDAVAAWPRCRRRSSSCRRTARRRAIVSPPPTITRSTSRPRSRSPRCTRSSTRSDRRNWRR